MSRVHLAALGMLAAVSLVASTAGASGIYNWDGGTHSFVVDPDGDDPAPPDSLTIDSARFGINTATSTLEFLEVYATDGTTSLTLYDAALDLRLDASGIQQWELGSADLALANLIYKGADSQVQLTNGFITLVDGGLDFGFFDGGGQGLDGPPNLNQLSFSTTRNGDLDSSVPVPEPASTVLFLVGLALAGRSVRSVSNRRC